MLFTLFKHLFLFQRYSSFQNMQISQVMKSHSQGFSGYPYCFHLLMVLHIILFWGAPVYPTILSNKIVNCVDAICA